MGRYLRIIFALVIVVRGAARDQYTNPYVAILTSTPKLSSGDRRVMRSPPVTPVRPPRLETTFANAQRHDATKAQPKQQWILESDLSAMGELLKVDDEEIIDMMVMLSRLTRDETKQWIKDQQAMWKKYNSRHVEHLQMEDEPENQGLMSLQNIWT